MQHAASAYNLLLSKANSSGTNTIARELIPPLDPILAFQQMAALNPEARPPSY